MICMSSSKKRLTWLSVYNTFRRKRLARIKNKLRWTLKEIELKNEAHKNSHSLMWIWEFSKKAVLVCFAFYIIVQIYSMIVMTVYCDFTHLGELINQTGEIVQNCVFGYLVKAGIENVVKIFWSKKNSNSNEEIIDDTDGPAG